MATKKTILFIFIVAILTRLLLLEGSAIHMDEVIWMVNSKEFLYSLFHLNFNYLKHAWWNNTTESYAIALPGTLLAGLSQFFLSGIGKYSLHLTGDVYASRLPIALIGAVFPIILYLTIRKYISNSVAVITAFAYAISPVVLTQDRWLLHDSFLTIFSLISLSSYYYYYEKKLFSLVPGLFLSLALLTKPTGVIVIPAWIALSFLKPNKTSTKQLISNCLATLCFVSFFWPESWFNPILAPFSYFIRQFTFAQSGLVNYYQGRATANPGWTYYFYEFCVKNPEIVVIFFGVGIFSLLISTREKFKDLSFYLYLTIYSLIYMAVITFSIAKPGIRYALPIFPWFYLTASIGFISFFKIVESSQLKIFIVLFGILSLLYPLTYIPDYQMYYNLFAGGTQKASLVDRVGVCLGTKQALSKMEDQKKGKIFIYGCADNAPYYTSLELTKKIGEARYLLIESYLRQLYPDDPKLLPIQNKEPIISIYQKGVLTAAVYENPSYGLPEVPPVQKAN